MDHIAKLFGRPQPDVVDRLVTLADGDVDLLQEAIRVAAGPDETADLEKIVSFLVDRRPQQPVSPA